MNYFQWFLIHVTYSTICMSISQNILEVIVKVLFFYCTVVYVSEYFKEFARRALGKIDKLARWEQENDVPASRQTQSAFREASIKAGDTFS